jgi:hypothetical protein
LLLPIFVRVRFAAGRLWLLVLLSALRVVATLVGVFGALGLHYSQLVMRPVQLPGGIAAWAPTGVVSPWLLVAHLNLLLILVFLADALLEMRRRGDAAEYRRACLVCAAIAVHVLVAGGVAALGAWGVIRVPFLATPSFLLPILVLSYELGDQLNAVPARAPAPRP